MRQKQRRYTHTKASWEEPYFKWDKLSKLTIQWNFVQEAKVRTELLSGKEESASLYGSIVKTNQSGIGKFYRGKSFSSGMNYTSRPWEKLLRSVGLSM